MEKDHQKALELAIRRHRGLQIRSSWLSALEEACNGMSIPENFLSLEETENLKKAFSEQVRKAQLGQAEKRFFHKYWPKTSWEGVGNVLSNLSIRVGSTSVALFSSVDKDVGAILVPADLILAHAESVWNVVGEDLQITTLNLENGLCLELNFFDETGDYMKAGIYELTSWGIFAP